ncbi:MAG: lamin tail domain-containing protein [Chitinispirillales bacterium]|jgi:hypothetical protein|nr:lamin tail domain-containing protein [Chitinispirillales bacterium]
MIRLIVSLMAAIAANAFSLGVVITEIHRDPAAGNKNAIPGGLSHQFVELTNFGSDTFYLADIFLTNGKTADSIRLFDKPINEHPECYFTKAYLPPGAIALILPQNYTAALEAAPSTVLPVEPGTIILTVNHKNLGGNLANDDGIAIYKGTRSRVDSLIDLAADPETHISSPTSGKIVLNPRQPKGYSVIPQSLILGGISYIVSFGQPMSPGRYESFQHGLYLEYCANMVSESVRCSVAGIFVLGKSENASWNLYSSSQNSSRFEIAKGVFDSQKSFLKTFDIALEQKRYFFEVVINNRTISCQIDLSGFWAAGGTLSLTELFPRGTSAAGQPEWFELKNVSSADVNLKGWLFGNAKDTAVITQRDFVLTAGNFLVVTKDSTSLRGKYRWLGGGVIQPGRWHTLNSYNDTLCVWSPRGVEVDKAVYRSAWFGGWSTQSLERVFASQSAEDSLSWVLCENPTPGQPGTAPLWRAVSAPSIDIGPVPFFPSKKGSDRFLSIRMNAPPGYKAKIQIISFDGRILKTIKGEKEAVLWDGICDGGRAAGPGVIYVVAEFTSGTQRKVIRKKGVLWR